MDYVSLLDQVREFPPYANWKSSGVNKYRDYDDNENAAFELSVFGLWHHGEQKLVKSLVSIAVELEIIKPVVRGEVDKDAWKIEAVDEERKKYQEKISSRFTKSNQKSWKTEDLPILWGYFALERGIWPETKDGRIPEVDWLRDFARLMWKIKAHVVRYHATDKVAETIEIRIPLLGLQRQVVQVQRIGVRAAAASAGKPGHWIKTFKRFKFQATAPRAICFGDESSHEAIIVEGLEDALTLWACGRFLNPSTGVVFRGNEKWFVVSCGTARLTECYPFAAAIDRRVVESGAAVNTFRVVDVYCDNNAKNEGVKATLALGDLVQRFIPKEIGVDANRALQDRGVVGLRDWWRGLELKGWREVSAAVEAEEDKEITAAEIDVHEYMRISRPWTDAGAVQVFLTRHGDVVRRTEDRRWWVFDGKRWLADPDEGMILARVMALVPVYQKIARQIAKTEGRESPKVEACLKYGNKLANMAGASPVIRALSGSARLRCKVSDFDSDKKILNVQNGVLLLETGQLVAHDPKHLCSRIASVDWNPGAESPSFDKFLTDIMCGDTDLILYKLRQYGYLLSGNTNEKAVFYHYGPGGDNGKSTEVDLLKSILGDYVQNVSESLFLEQRFGNEEMYATARLPGIRVAVCGEIDESKAWSESSVKRVSGGSDSLVGREITKSPFEFIPMFKLLIHANNLPKVKTGDAALWNRLHLIPYDMKLAPEAIDPDLVDKMKGEASGILYRMWQGYCAWKKTRLAPPESVIEAREEYRGEVFEDVELFLEGCCEFWREENTGRPLSYYNGEEITESMSKLYSAYKQFCKRTNCRYKSQTAFGRELSTRGFEKVRVSKGGAQKWFRLGLRLNIDSDSASASDFDDDETDFV